MHTTTATRPPLNRRGGGPHRPASHPGAIERTFARLGWSFSAPALVVVLAVTIFPIVFSVVLSLSNVMVLGSGYHLSRFTLHNYAVIFTAPVWQYALVFTVVYTIITVSVELILGTAIAVVLERMVRGRGIMMAFLLVPWSLITVISAKLFRYMYNYQFGIITAISQGLGLGHPSILGHSTSAIIAMMVADIWKTTPFVAIIVLAGLVMIDQDLYEAAAVDGASPWAVFWQISLPLVRPTIALAVLFRILQAFGVFDLPFVLTQGGPGNATTSLAILGFQTMFTNIDFGTGAAVATSTAALVVIGCLLFLKVFRAQVGHEEVS